jgi:hypothetical protein
MHHDHQKGLRGQKTHTPLKWVNDVLYLCIIVKIGQDFFLRDETSVFGVPCDAT